MGFNAIGSNGKPMMNLDRLISSSRTCTTLEFSLAQNHMFSSGQQGEEELGQEFGRVSFSLLLEVEIKCCISSWLIDGNGC
jgi:hypothetical protein